MRRLFSMLAALTAMTSGCTPLDDSPAQSAPGTTTTIIMVRHAERDPGSNPPPTEPLNDEGFARAIALADRLENEGITAIYASDLTRNIQTIGPLLERIDVPVKRVSALRLLDTKALANSLVDQWMSDEAGGVVLWVGNTGPVNDNQSGNLQEIFTRLGGTGRAPVRYQDLFIITVDDAGGVHVDKDNFGGPSSLD